LSNRVQHHETSGLYETSKRGKLRAEDRFHNVKDYENATAYVRGIRVSNGKERIPYVVFEVNGKEKEIPYASVSMPQNGDLRKGDRYRLIINEGRGDRRGIFGRIAGRLGFKRGAFEIRAVYEPQTRQPQRVIAPVVYLQGLLTMAVSGVAAFLNRATDLAAAQWSLRSTAAENDKSAATSYKSSELQFTPDRGVQRAWISPLRSSAVAQPQRATSRAKLIPMKPAAQTLQRTAASQPQPQKAQLTIENVPKAASYEPFNSAALETDPEMRSFATEAKNVAKAIEQLSTKAAQSRSARELAEQHAAKQRALYSNKRGQSLGS
jgi:hypothetical protein